MKTRVLAEVFRVLADGGELHISDWGKPAKSLMRALFYPVQVLDGFSNTSDNVQGLLAEFVKQAGARQAFEQASFNTMFGTLRSQRAIV